MIDALLAQQIAVLLAPFLPGLMKAGSKAVETAGGKAGEAAWNKAVNLWSKLRPQVEKEPEVAKALQELAEKGDDPRAQAVLSWQLEKLLAALPPETLEEIREIVAEPGHETHITIATGGSIAVGRDASENVMITKGRD
jgi:hypothetical protein